MGKVIGNANSVSFAKGGKTKMFGKGHANAMEPGTTAKASQEAGDGGKFAKGGSTKMFGKGHANPMTPGVTAKASQ